MKIIDLIKWLQSLEQNPKEKFKGETGFMIHGIITELWYLRALKRVLKIKNIEITPKEIGKNLYK